MDAEKIRIDTEKIKAQVEADKKSIENIDLESEAKEPNANENNTITI